MPPADRPRLDRPDHAHESRADRPGLAAAGKAAAREEGPGSLAAGADGAGLERLAGQGASLADQAVASIRAAIRDGRLRPGRLYSAYQLAGDLGVSRSPVREALMRLAEASVVCFERNKGFRIVIPGPADIAEVFQLRLLLEVPAARRAARRPPAGLATRLRAELDRLRAAAEARDEARFMRHDQQLHQLILEAAGNARLTALVGNLRDATRTLGASTADRSRGLDDIAAEHVPIVDAILVGDAEAAGAAMARHVSHTGRLLMAQAVADAGGGPGVVGEAGISAGSDGGGEARSAGSDGGGDARSAEAAGQREIGWAATDLDRRSRTAGHSAAMIE